MTVRFGNNRLAFYIAVFLLSGAVLGLSANFITLFSSSFKSGFLVFSLLVTSLNIFVFLLTLQWSQPRIEVFVLSFFAILWLAMGAWATDIIGNVQCSELSGWMSTKSGSHGITNHAYCSEMKVIQAFSWALFAMFLIALYILFQLIGQSKKFGRFEIEREPIRELPWFDEVPGYYNTHTSAPQGQYPGYPQYPYPVPQSAGHGVIIQPGMNGAPPTVTQIP